MGTILGKKVVTEDGMEMNVFLGIPYAQPPVDRLRFQTPRPVYGYKDFEAFAFGNSCPQQKFFIQVIYLIICKQIRMKLKDALKLFTI